MTNWLIFLGVWSVIAVVVAPLVGRAFFDKPSRTSSLPVTIPGSEAAPLGAQRDDATAPRGASQQFPASTPEKRPPR